MHNIAGTRVQKDKRSLVSEHQLDHEDFEFLQSVITEVDESPFIACEQINYCLRILNSSFPKSW